MMSPWFYLLLVLPALPLVIEDFRLRRISVVWLGVMGVLTFLLAVIDVGWRQVLLYTALNCISLTLLTALLALWLQIRGRQPRQLFRMWIGSGDIVLMAVLTPLFAPDTYVRFVLAACLAGLAWWMVKRPTTIPLAGIMALALTGYTMCKIAGL